LEFCWDQLIEHFLADRTQLLEEVSRVLILAYPSALNLLGALSQKAVTKKRVLVKISELAEAKHLR
jgi:hypothetical protein